MPTDIQKLINIARQQIFSIETTSAQRLVKMSARTDVEATRVQASTGVTPESLKSTLVEKLGATHVQIEDMSGN